jgi:NAD(P)-dependent dehydrogenase (short-subunit alcohol dehydrogenase family)
VPTADLAAVVGDLGSQRATTRIASQIENSFGGLDVLVNNAAVVRNSASTNGDGVELTFATNYVAVYLLTRLLLPTLERSPDARVVLVGSEAHRGVALDFGDLQSRANYERFSAYARSKLAVLLFARELASRVGPEGTLIITMHPGTTKTTLFRPRNVIERVVMPVLDLRARPPEVAAESIRFLAVDEAARGLHGDYVYDGRPVEPSSLAQDDTTAKRLWKVTAEMTGLEP